MFIHKVANVIREKAAFDFDVAKLAVKNIKKSRVPLRFVLASLVTKTIATYCVVDIILAIKLLAEGDPYTSGLNLAIPAAALVFCSALAGILDQAGGQAVSDWRGTR